MKIVDLEKYRTTKQISGKSAEIKEYLTRLNAFFEENYGDKSWGWVGTTALLYSNMAIKMYLESENDHTIYPSIMGMLWQFQNDITKICKKNKGDK